METLLRERFLKTYANIPLNLREDIILVFQDDKDKIRKTLTWNTAYIEVKANSDVSEKILTGLDELGLI